MAKEILVVKNGKKEGKLDVKVTTKMNKGYAPSSYLKVLDIKDSEDLATLFSDLSILFDAPVDQAFRKYKDKNNLFY